MAAELPETPAPERRWRDVHPDYRATVDGVRMVLTWDPTAGTVLVPWCEEGHR